METAVSPNTVFRLKMGHWLPLAALPGAVVLAGGDWQPWVYMGMLAISIYAGFKWLTFSDCPAGERAPLGRSLGYLLLWPGMDAPSFFGRPGENPRFFEWLAAIAKSALGAALIFGAAPVALQSHPLLAGWLGMIGIAFAFHFGLLDGVSLAWRRAAVNARPIMRAPIMASSLGDFWGRRWNLAFRDLAHAYVFRPLLRRCGPVGATMAVFLASGLLHDLAISLPARGGGGLPTIYFLIQGIGVLFEHSRAGKAMGLGGKLTGRLFVAVVILGPLPMLFHKPFVERVVLPLLGALGAW